MTHEEALQECARRCLLASWAGDLCSATMLESSAEDVSVLDKALYTPPDVAEAYNTWKASCGPCALAAVLRQPLAAVRPLFPWFPRRPYATPTDLMRAISMATWEYRKRTPRWPRYGLAFLQWEGPWLDRGVPPVVAYRYTHWVGVAHHHGKGTNLYDVNAHLEAEARGGWLPVATWQRDVKPLLVAAIPRATGGVYLRWSCEVLARGEGA